MKSVTKIMTLMICTFLTLVHLNGQVKMTAKNNVNVSVSGTSTMHDWVMKSSAGECSVTIVMDGSGNITGVTQMNISIPAKALKSGKGGMDKNAYKALKTDSNPNITATLKSANVTTKDNKNYTVKSVIKLTIAGKTLETDLVAQVKKINDNSISIKVEKPLAMKDYDVEPPSFMLGAVKTGNEVVLNFDFILNQ